MILVVDDDKDICDSLSEVLKDCGYPVETAHHGEAALRLLESGARPSLILLDLMMPQMDGFGFLDAMRAVPDWEHIPVIVLSAHGPQRDPRLAHQRVLQAFAKPVDIARLCDAVRGALSPA